MDTITEQSDRLNSKIKKFFRNAKEYTQSKIIFISMIKDFVFAAGKIGLGIYTLSVFLCISGLNSGLMGLARRTYLHGEKIARGDSEKEYKSYLKIALFILGGATAFTLYMTRLFFIPSSEHFDMISAIAIATMAFTELGFAIVGVAKTKDLLASAIKILNLTAAFSAIVMTQIAILSFTSENDLSYYNAIGGVVFGGLSILAVLYMLLRYLLHKLRLKHS